MLKDIAESVVKAVLEEKESIEIDFGDIDFINRMLANMFDVKEKPKDFSFKAHKRTQNFHSDVLLVSGGLDSTIAFYYILKTTGKPPFCIYVDAGQQERFVETEALVKLGINFITINSPIRYGNKMQPKWEHILPGRNFLFISYAADFIASCGNIWIASISGETPQQGGDKSIQFFKDVELLSYIKDGKEFYIRTLQSKTKRDWIIWFKTNGPFSNEEDQMKYLKSTVSCFNSDLSGKGCGKCRACFRKWVAFTSAGVPCDELFSVHPYIGGERFVNEYKERMGKAISNKDFSYFSRDRIDETLGAIEDYEKKHGSNA